MTTPTRPDVPGLDARVLDALGAVFGAHPESRALHAKGAVFSGTFTAAPTALLLSRAPHFDGRSRRVTVRLSNYAGVPTIHDGDPAASPRGIAVRVHLDGDAFTDLLAHSYDGFPVKTADDFALFLNAIASSAAGERADTQPIAVFLDAHPAAKAFVLDPKPAPLSFAHEAFFGVHAFRFTNSSGETRLARYRLVPFLRGERLDREEAARRAPDFLFAEIDERLGNGPVLWRVLAQLAGDGDPVDDATAHWPEDRPLIELGTLEIDAAVPHDAAAQRALAFHPAHLVDGIALSADPLLRARPGVYAEGARRRQTASQ